MADKKEPLGDSPKDDYGETSEDTTELLEYSGTIIPLLEAYDAVSDGKDVQVVARCDGGNVIVKQPDGAVSAVDKTTLLARSLPGV